MRRREFIAGIGSAATWPLLARGRQSDVPVVGLLSGTSFEGPYAVPAAAIRQGLQETGFVEGRSVAIEYRAANGQYERLPELADELVRSQVAVILAIGAPTSALLKIPASVIPIVFASGSDVAEVGLVTNRERSGSNLMGSSVAAAGVASKRLELLLELVPRATLVGYLDNSRFSAAFEAIAEDLATAARINGRELAVFDAATEEEVETAFTNMALRRVRALVVSPDPFLTMRQEQIIALASESMLPAIYAARGAVVLGGLVSYGILNDDRYRLAGIYAGQVLKGATPAESPMMLPTRFTLVVNNGTAKALRIAVPRRLMVRADEIIG